VVAPARAFRLLVVPGVTVDKWARMWSQRQPGVELRVVPGPATDAAALLTDQADAGLVRTPVDRDAFHAISLYTEVTVAVVARDHLLTAADELTVADLADETLLRPLDEVIDWGDAPVATDRPETTADAVELVAAGVGILVVPQSLARLHHRRDVTHRPVTDAPTSSVALAWRPDRYDELVEEMIGIVRGRTANSTRGGGTPTPPVRRDSAPSRRKPPRRRDGKAR
jgi:hypothetical protein